MKNRTLIALSALVAGSLALSACGASSAPSPETSEETGTGTLQIGARLELTHALAAIAYNGADYPTLYAVYDRLIHFDPETMELLPDAGLAAEWGWSDDANTRFNVKLKEGITFHDGTPVDAAAAKASLDYQRNAREVEPLANRDLEIVTEVNVLGDYEFEIVLAEAFSPLPAILSDRPGMLMSPTAIETYGAEAGSHGAGTGPYIFSSWEKGIGWSLERNPDYYGGTPSMDGIDFTLITDEQARLNAFRSGQIDMYEELNAIDVASVEGVNGIRVSPEKSEVVAMLQVAATLPPFDDERVRQAVNMAIDREAIVGAMYPTVPHAREDLPTNIPIPLHNWAANETDGGWYDVDEARRLLREAGYGNGLAIKVCTTSGDANSLTAMEIIQGQLAEVGIDMSMEIQPTVSICQEGTTTGTYQGIAAGLSGRPDPYMNYKLITTALAMGGEYPTVAELLSEVAAAPGRDEQKKIYEELNDHWQEVVPVVVLFNRPKLVGYAEYVEGSSSTAIGKELLANLSLTSKK